MSIMVRLGIGSWRVAAGDVIHRDNKLLLINKIDQNLEYIAGNSHVRTEKSWRALIALNEVVSNVKIHILTSNRNLKEQALKDTERGIREYHEAIAKLEELDRSASGKALISKLKEMTAVAAATNNKALELEKNGQHDEAVTLLVNELVPAAQRTEKTFNDVFKYQKEQSLNNFTDASHYGSNARLLNGTLSELFRLLSASS